MVSISRILDGSERIPYIAHEADQRTLHCRRYALDFHSHEARLHDHEAMARSWIWLLCSLNAIAGPRFVRGQQLGLVKYPVDALGISDDCASALNTTVDCSDFLGYAARGMSVGYPRMT